MTGTEHPLSDAGVTRAGRCAQRGSGTRRSALGLLDHCSQGGVAADDDAVAARAQPDLT